MGNKQLQYAEIKGAPLLVFISVFSPESAHLHSFSNKYSVHILSFLTQPILQMVLQNLALCRTTANALADVFLCLRIHETICTGVFGFERTRSVFMAQLVERDPPLDRATRGELRVRSNWQISAETAIFTLAASLPRFLLAGWPSEDPQSQLQEWTETIIAFEQFVR